MLLHTLDQLLQKPYPSLLLLWANRELRVGECQLVVLQGKRIVAIEFMTETLVGVAEGEVGARAFRLLDVVVESVSIRLDVRE